MCVIWGGLRIINHTNINFTWNNKIKAITVFDRRSKIV